MIWNHLNSCLRLISYYAWRIIVALPFDPWIYKIVISRNILWSLHKPFKLFQDLTEEEISESLKSKPRHPPTLHIFRAARKVAGAGIAADTVKIICEGDSFESHIVDLIAVYYVFQLSYPKIYSQLLGVLQTFVVKRHPYNGQMSSKYKAFVAKLRPFLM